MKKISIILLSVVVAGSSCKKDNFSEFRNEVSGEWELIQSSSVIGIPQAPLPPGNGKIIFLGMDGTFQRRTHDTVLVQTTYSLKKKKDCYMDGMFVFINTVDGSYTNDRMKIAVENDTLRFSTSSCLIDGGGAIYRRLSE